jgi:DNA gyrase subunit A
LEIGTVSNIDINQEMRNSYLDYAMSVIVARALPDARDGLKPVHRRILYAMYDMGLRPNQQHRKSARLVGEVLGKYHPHGDSAVYEAMVRMAQDFSMRYPLVDGQGNFGSIDGDSPAAMRYTETRMAPIAMEMLEDIDKDTVDWVPNFDDTLMQPDVLPARLPNLLLNGTSGIAVGMATNIPPHNLTEICDALIYLIDRQDDVDDVTLDELMEFVKGPDFPTSGVILGTEGIRSAYATGRGRVVMRGVAEIEPIPRGNTDRMQINITELPFQVNKSLLIERMAELVTKGIIPDISDIRDSSDRNGISIVVELKRNTQPRKVLNQLFKHDSADDARNDLMAGFGLSEAQAVAILDMQLRRLAALERLKIEEEHREISLQIAYYKSLLDDPKLILALIKDDLQMLKEKYGDARRTQFAPGSDGDFDIEDLIKDEPVFVSITARGYIKRTPLTAYRIQGRGGKGLIGMSTRGEDELMHLFVAGSLNTLLFFSDMGKVYAIKTYEIPELDRTAKGVSLMNLLPLMPEERITAVLPVKDFDDGEYLIMITRKGKIKRVDLSLFANVRPSGLIAVNLDEGDSLGWVKMTQGGEDIILISEQGKGIRFSEEDVRPMGRTATGVNAIRLDTWDQLAGADMVNDDDDLFLITEKGAGKRTPLSEYRRQSRYGMGVKAMTLSPERTGAIVGARVVSDSDEVTLISSSGIILRTQANHISRQGRMSQGVRVMDLRNGDAVASMAVIRLADMTNGDGETAGGPSNGTDHDVAPAIAEVAETAVAMIDDGDGLAEE